MVGKPVTGGAGGSEGFFVHGAQEMGVAHDLDAAYFLDFAGALGEVVGWVREFL